MAIPKTFVFNVGGHELRETANSVLDYMEQLRNRAITEASCYDAYKNGRKVKAKAYRHSAYRLASILSALVPDELLAVGDALDESPMLARYDPLNGNTFSIIAAKQTGKLKRKLRGILEAVDTEDSGEYSYHVLQAALYLGKKPIRPFQPGLKPQEIEEGEKELLIEKFFTNSARLINNVDDGALDSIVDFENKTYNPGWRLREGKYLRFEFHRDISDTQFVLEREDFEDMIRYQRKDRRTGDYIEPDDVWDSDDRTQGRTSRSYNRKDLFLIKFKELGYFMASYDIDFHGNVLYMDSFAPDAGALLKRLNGKSKKHKRAGAFIEWADKDFNKKITDRFCRLAKALGYLAVATHWIPAGREYETLQDAGFRQVDVKRQFEHFVDDDNEFMHSDAIVLWKNLYNGNAACAD